VPFEGVAAEALGLVDARGVVATPGLVAPTGFVETPGVHKPKHRRNVRMVDVALDAKREVDVLTLVVDASVKPGPGDRYLLDLLKDVKTPTILALNKVDLVAKHRMVEELTAEHAECPIDQNSLGVGDQCRTQTTVTHGRQFVASPRPPGPPVPQKIAHPGVQPLPSPRHCPGELPPTQDRATPPHRGGRGVTKLASASPMSPEWNPYSPRPSSSEFPRSNLATAVAMTTDTT